MAKGGMTLDQLKQRDRDRANAKRAEQGKPLLPAVVEPRCPIPADALANPRLLTPAMRAQIEKELQRRGELPKPKVAWDPADVPPSAYDVRNLRGAGWELWHSRDFETILHGPAESAKTWNCCRYLNALLWKYPGAQGVMLRKTYSSAIGTCVRSYLRLIGQNTPIKAYGGEKPEWFDYPNGSRLWVAGLDNLAKVLSGERDFFYLNQAEEFSLEEWETITSRATGRGSVMPYTRVFADCNPGPPSHWILSRPSIKLLKATHRDNPTLFDEVGEITEQGRKSLGVLEAMTGMRRMRLYEGKWVQAEGVVFDEFDRDVHTVPAFQIPSEWRRIRVIDFGYTNPFVCAWIAIDPDGRMYVYREIYITGVLVSEIARDIRKLSAGEDIEATICDHDAEDRATLAAEGIRSIPAFKGVKQGIEAVKNRLKVQADGKPRYMILRDSQEQAPLTFPLVQPDPDLAEKKKPTRGAQEFEFYVWAKGVDGKPNKEEPVKEYDHFIDSGARYAVCYVDKIGKRRGRAY